MYCVFHSVYCIELFIPCQPLVFIFQEQFYLFSLLFSSNTIWIVALNNSFSITMWTIFVCHPNFEEHRLFIFTWFVITRRTLSVKHSSLLGLHIQRLSSTKGLHKKTKLVTYSVTRKVTETLGGV